jgi:hypothetical protein
MLWAWNGIERLGRNCRLSPGQIKALHSGFQGLWAIGSVSGLFFWLNAFVDLIQ